MNSIDTLCTSCRRRYAVYKRRSSGEILCKLCLFRSLVKQTRKAVNHYQMMHRNGSALYIIRPDSIGESIIGFSLYRNSIKGYDTKIYVLCIDGITRCQDIEPFFNGKTSKYLKVDISYVPSNKIEMVKFVEAIAVRIARKFDIEFIVSPLFRDELTLFLLAGILTTSGTIFSEGLPMKIVDNIKIVRPFFYVMSVDVVIMKILDHVDIEPNIGFECENYIRKAKSMLYSSLELMYSSTKVIELFQKYAFDSSKRCRYCGAYTSSNLCNVCERFYQYIDGIE
ncbi:MAG: hypothetical protein QXG46_00845 [Ignisphaera sp.]